LKCRQQMANQKRFPDVGLEIKCGNPEQLIP